MPAFPMQFEVFAKASSGMNQQWESHADSLAPVPCSIPPGFSGPGNAYSPEDLFGMALLNCLIATFLVYAEKAQASFDNIQGKIQLTVDKLQKESGFGMSHADVYLEISGAQESEKIRGLLDSAIKDCAVSNSIKTGKTFHIDIH